MSRSEREIDRNLLKLDIDRTEVNILSIEIYKKNWKKNRVLYQPVVLVFNIRHWAIQKTTSLLLCKF